MNFADSHSFIFAGGKVCKIGEKWVVNPSGGLLSKGNHSACTLLIIPYIRVFNELCDDISM